MHCATTSGIGSKIPYADLPEFTARLRDMPGVAAKALAFVILTAARSGEVLGARWDEIDLDAETWTIPASRMKMGKEHVVPLSDQAISMLRDQMAARGKNPSVFPSHFRVKRCRTRRWRW